jgi:hypothetical protein
MHGDKPYFFRRAGLIPGTGTFHPIVDRVEADKVGAWKNAPFVEELISPDA